MPCQVIWLIQAEDVLQNALSGAGLSTPDATAKQNEISGKLRETFPNADAVVVLDRLPGYSNRVEKHVFRVEVHTAKRIRARVVKINSPDQLKAELEGWQSCKRRANDRGRAFMTLKPGKPGPAADTYDTLIYQDAHQTLRAADLVSLEQVVLDCIRRNTPSLTSVLAMLDQVFAELIDRCYSRSQTVTLTEDDQTALKERLRTGHEQWKDPKTIPGTAREFATGKIPQGPFVDLCTFYDQVFVRYDPDLLPEMRRGPSHGDLNGSLNGLLG